MRGALSNKWNLMYRQHRCARPGPDPGPRGTSIIFVLFPKRFTGIADDAHAGASEPHPKAQSAGQGPRRRPTALTGPADDERSADFELRHAPRPLRHSVGRPLQKGAQRWKCLQP